MSRKMAEVIVREYAATGLNATEAARRAGYAESTAESRGYDIVQIATQRILEAAREEKRKPSLAETKSLIEILGLTPVETMREYLKIIAQDRDVSTKLKAITPLMRTIDPRFSDGESTQQSPVHITVERVETLENKGDIHSVGKDSFRDTIRDVELETPEENPSPEAPTSPQVESE